MQFLQDLLILKNISNINIQLLCMEPHFDRVGRSMSNVFCKNIHKFLLIPEIKTTLSAQNKPKPGKQQIQLTCLSNECRITNYYILSLCESHWLTQVKLNFRCVTNKVRGRGQSSLLFVTTFHVTISIRGQGVRLF